MISVTGGVFFFFINRCSECRKPNNKCRVKNTLEKNIRLHERNLIDCVSFDCNLDLFEILSGTMRIYVALKKKQRNIFVKVWKL